MSGLAGISREGWVGWGFPRLLGKVEPGEVTGRKEKGGHSSPCEFKVDQEAGIAEGWTICRLGTPGIRSLFRCLRAVWLRAGDQISLSVSWPVWEMGQHCLPQGAVLTIKCNKKSTSSASSTVSPK